MKKEKRPMRTRATEARRKSAVLAIVSTSTIEAAAKLSGVGKTTLYTWMNDSTFMDELTGARAAAFGEGLNMLKAAVQKAAGVLIALLDSKHETTRRQAAVSVIELGIHAQEAADLEARLTRLEDAIAVWRRG